MTSRKKDEMTARQRRDRNLDSLGLGSVRVDIQPMFTISVVGPDGEGVVS